MPKAGKKSGKGSSSTPGKSKGANCQRSQLKNILAKDTRAYRTKPDLWARACAEADKLKGNRSSAGTTAQ